MEWRPQNGKQTEALRYRVFEELYGGARGGGKTAAGIAWLAIDIEHPKYRALVIRKNADDLKDWVDKARALYVPMGATITGQSPEIRFPWGAVIRTGHLNDDNAYEKYQGQEYCRILIEELTQIPTEERYLKLISSCRSAIPELKARVFCTTNPGGQGHAWVKRRFVDVIEPMKVYKDPTTGRGRVFIPATVHDNPILTQADPGYVAFLDGLPEALRKAWRDGNWDSFAGQFFAEWDASQHVIEPFTIPENWARFRSIDPSGRNGTTSCHLYALDSDGNVYVTHEHYKSGLDSDQHADEIAKMSEGIDLKYTCMDTSAWSKLGLPESTAEIYERHGVQGLIQSDKKRIPGWNVVHQYLRWDINTPPKLRIFKTCYNLIRTLPLAIHDDKNPEDVKSFYDGAEHGDALDELRYALQTLREQKSAQPVNQVERLLKEMKERKEQMDFQYRTRKS